MSRITKDRLLELFSVDPEAGRIFWLRPTKYHSRLTGAEAGTPCRNSHNEKTYWVIKIGRASFKRGHLIFLYVHGWLPSPCLDHINGNSLDDRAVNIREATVTENAWNHKKRARKHNLPMGVRLINRSGRYQARISFNKTQIHLGAFDTPEEASAVYQAKRKELYREFA